MWKKSKMPPDKKGDFDVNRSLVLNFPNEAYASDFSQCKVSNPTGEDDNCDMKHTFFVIPKKRILGNIDVVELFMSCAIEVPCRISRQLHHAKRISFPKNIWTIKCLN